MGNFDGVHKGHGFLLSHALEVCSQKSLSPVVLTFEPHPRVVLGSLSPREQLTPFKSKMKILKSMNFRGAVVLPFNRRTMMLSATSFVQDVLVNLLDAQHIFIGRHFRFGHKREGTEATLRAFLKVTSVDLQNKSLYASTYIRSCLERGELDKAEEALGRPFSLEGRVVYGDQRGRTIGFPTANLFVGGALLPKRGVYAVRVRDLTTGEKARGVANIGWRPTVGGKEERVEVHLFGSHGSLYHHTLRMELSAYLREEGTFPTLKALQSQIAVDCEKAHLFFQ